MKLRLRKMKARRGKFNVFIFVFPFIPLTTFCRILTTYHFKWTKKKSITISSDLIIYFQQDQELRRLWLKKIERLFCHMFSPKSIVEVSGSAVFLLLDNWELNEYDHTMPAITIYCTMSQGTSIFSLSKWVLHHEDTGQESRQES